MMNGVMISVSLLDLQVRTDSSLEQVTWLLSARALGNIVGGLLLGWYICTYRLHSQFSTERFSGPNILQLQSDSTLEQVILSHCFDIARKGMS
jgi:formate/nitrite transporter FocA (FNT family)